MRSRANQVLPLAAAAACVFALFALVGGVGYAIFDQRETNSALCEQAVENRDSLRLAFETTRQIFKGQSENDPDIDLLFDAILRPIPALECVNNQPVPKEGM